MNTTSSIRLRTARSNSTGSTAGAQPKKVKAAPMHHPFNSSALANRLQKLSVHHPLSLSTLLTPLLALALASALLVGLPPRAADASTCESSFQISLLNMATSGAAPTRGENSRSTATSQQQSQPPRGFFARAGISIQEAARRFEQSTLLRRSAEQLIAAAEARPTNYRPASRTNFLADQEAEKTWKGLSGQLLNFPSWLRLIERYLPTSKSRGFIGEVESNFTSLRVEWGDKLKTNIGIGASALRTMFFRSADEVRKVGIAPDWAKAIVIYLHGGGTASTGHHVGKEYQQNLEAMNIYVASMDYVLHGHGWQKSPTEFRAAAEEMRRLAKLIRGDSNRPIYLEGHSMGGVFVSMYRQYYPGDDLFAGVIANSEIIDPLPKGGFWEKLARFDELDRWTSLQDELTEYMRNLPRSLMANGKLSLCLGMVCDAWISILDQTPPSDNGASSIPILRNMGVYDPLFYHPDYRAGFARMASEQNTFVTIMDERRIKEDPSGPLEKIDHMITDHRVRIDFATKEIKNADGTVTVIQLVSADIRKGILELNPKYREKFEELRRLGLEGGGLVVIQPEWTKSVRTWTWDDLRIPETHLITANFIEKTSGVELGVRRQKSQDPKELAAAPATTTWITSDAVDHMLWSYTAIPAFREFAATYTYIHARLNPEKHASIKPQQDELKKLHKRLTEALGAASAQTPGWVEKVVQAHNTVLGAVSMDPGKIEAFAAAFPNIANQIRAKRQAVVRHLNAQDGQSRQERAEHLREYADALDRIEALVEVVSDEHTELTNLMRDKGRPLPQHRKEWLQLKEQLERIDQQAALLAAPPRAAAAAQAQKLAGGTTAKEKINAADDLSIPNANLKLEELGARQEKIITSIKPRQKRFERMAQWIEAPATIGALEAEVAQLLEQAFAEYGGIREQFSQWLYQNLNPDKRSYKPGLFERMPREMWAQVEAFDARVAQLKAKNKELVDLRFKTALSGRFGIKAEVKKTTIANTKDEKAAKAEPPPTVEEIQQLAREITQFEDALTEAHQEIDRRTREYARLQNESLRIELRMRALQDTEYFEFRVMTPQQLLARASEIRNLPSATEEDRKYKESAMKDFESIASRMMGDWNRIWSLRLRDVGAPDSLY